MEGKREHPTEKSGLHPRNRHRERYDFVPLIAVVPELKAHVKLNEYGDESIDFFDPEAVKLLNKSLLLHFYNIEYWEIPEGYLCPPIPGRADYIHHIADLLAESNNNIVPKGNHIRCLDIGVGANCVYPIIGHQEYGWSFVGSDTDLAAVKSAKKIVEMNPALKGNVEIRSQWNSRDIFTGIIKDEERFDLVVCNPPFHSSAEEARSGSVRKLQNLKRKKIANPVLNFGGQSNELWRKGGEEKFVTDMIYDSRRFAGAVQWFSTLISKESNLKAAYRHLNIAEAEDVRTIDMTQGNKKSRVLAWRY